MRSRRDAPLKPAQRAFLRRLLDQAGAGEVPWLARMIRNAGFAPLSEKRIEKYSPRADAEAALPMVVSALKAELKGGGIAATNAARELLKLAGPRRDDADRPPVIQIAWIDLGLDPSGKAITAGAS